MLACVLFPTTAVIECQFDGAVRGPAGEASSSDDIIRADGICCWEGEVGCVCGEGCSRGCRKV